MFYKRIKKWIKTTITSNKKIIMNILKPSDSKDKVISYQIIINGVSVNEKYKIFKIITRKKVNKISRAIVYILGGDTQNNNFNESNDKIFDNGNEIEIKMGYDQNNFLVFKGIIDTHSVLLKSGYQQKPSSSLLMIECVDKAIQLTNSYTNEIFEDLSDKEIFNKIINKVPGLSSNIDESNQIHSIFPKYNNNDWRFLIKRCSDIGFLVFNSNNNISITSPSFAKSSELEISNDGATVSFSGHQSSTNQYNKVIVSSTDSFNNEKISIQGKETNSLLVNQNIDVNKSLTPEVVEINYANDLSNSEIENIASSKINNARNKSIYGSVKFKGVTNIDLESVVTLNGFGEKFNSDVYVTAISHELVDGIILTEIDYGLKNDFLESSDSINKHNNINKISGLHIGKVSQITGDPKNELRIKVVIPELKEIKNAIWEGIFDKGIWAKLSHVYVSKDSGLYFVPDIGTQVVISFLAEDPKQPIILGSLNTVEHIPYKDMDSANNFKAIVTKNKLMLEFDEEDNQIKLSTNSGNQITINEKQKEIIISDENNNIIKTSTDGIEISSSSDINFKSSGSINLSANNKVNIISKSDAVIKGSNIINSAQIKFSANGSASSELTSSGSTNIQGSIIKIN